MLVAGEAYRLLDMNSVMSMHCGKSFREALSRHCEPVNIYFLCDNLKQRVLNPHNWAIDHI